MVVESVERDLFPRRGVLVLEVQLQSAQLEGLFAAVSLPGGEARGARSANSACSLTSADASRD